MVRPGLAAAPSPPTGPRAAPAARDMARVHCAAHPGARSQEPGDSGARGLQLREAQRGPGQCVVAPPALRCGANSTARTVCNLRARPPAAPPRARRAFAARGATSSAVPRRTASRLRAACRAAPPRRRSPGAHRVAARSRGVATSTIWGCTLCGTGLQSFPTIEGCGPGCAATPARTTPLSASADGRRSTRSSTAETGAESWASTAASAAPLVAMVK